MLQTLFVCLPPAFIHKGLLPSYKADCLDADFAGGTRVYKYMRMYLYSAPTVEAFKVRFLRRRVLF
jgi:hypothetical protein